MMHQVLIRPVITEKSMGLAKSGWFTFAVDITSDKNMIASAIEKQFKVNVMGVKTITMPGKSKRTGKKRTESMAKHWKKAIVKLKKDQKIDLFAVTETEKK
ncbi:50S ribosomal protein L23 [Candidatus Microgenomates bacterium]|nr:MAG: 50S ribosomal protein L23 [Candidatus Microgenomates bacterium]